MKKITLTLIGLFYLNVAFSQTYSTGMMQLSNTSGLEFSAQIDVTSSMVTLTMIGPSDRWLGLGFGIQSMTSGGDVVIYTEYEDPENPGSVIQELTDRSFGFPGQEPGEDAIGITPTEDPEGERDWTITSNTVNSGVRTLIATRASDTGQLKDYAFSASATSIELVWARYGFAGFDLEWHGVANKGVTMQGLTLSEDDFTVNSFNISPNPATESLNINLASQPKHTTTINVFDVLGKKVFEKELNSKSSSVDVSRWKSGIYLVKITTQDTFQTKRFVKQ